MTILIYIVFLSFIIYASYGPQSSFIAPLPGVEVVRSTNVVVPGGRAITIEKFGLIIVSPPDALPDGLFSVINIRLGISGPYIYPDSDTNHTMVAASPVYWLSSSKEFLKPLQFGIRHYTSQKSIIKVYTADNNQMNMSYIFEEIPNVTVSRDYVYFSVNHFSGFSANSTETTFCGTLYYQRSPTVKFQWDYNYVISQCSLVDLHDFDKTWSKQFKNHMILFEEHSTEIELVIEFNPSKNWSVVASFDLVYTKEILQMNYIANNMQFSLQWTRNDGLPASEELKFFLKGARTPRNITVKTQSIDYWEYYLYNKFFIVVASVVTIMIGFFILILVLSCQGNKKDILILFIIMIIIISIFLISYCFQDHINEIIKYLIFILQSILAALLLYLVFYRLVPEMKSTLVLEQLWNKLLFMKNNK
ncbi:PREDICTED: uncharacterized protein LOC109588805 [Amphimedon queenslandica]|nr:PREDICTED: uncharacterized protein LOC109588805 [Amphimedon queenslandica]XP_019860479.1 PREDICTED: uncharacterized protein LOC109588805 [Amphimedon queenslandica]|eukprot:XP_019860478.1 PREDICTED: uncharacterized protein LOC109588805 [Amphimedon queenslandica]